MHQSVAGLVRVRPWAPEGAGSGSMHEFMHQSVSRPSLLRPSTRALEQDAHRLATRVQATPRNAVPSTPVSDHRLDDGTRLAMEKAFNHDFSRIRVRHDAAARDLSARAYTVGNDLVFAP